MDDQNVDAGQLRLETATLEALARAANRPNRPQGGGGGSINYGPQMDLSTNTTDLYLQIAYLDTNTVRVTLTNTQNRIYELQTKTAITDTNWVSEKVLEGVTPMTPTNITMGTRPRLFFQARTYMPTNGQLFVTVPSSVTNFAPLVNGSVYTGSPVAEFPSQKLYVLNPPLYSVNLGYGCDDYWPGYSFPNTPPGSPVSNAQQNATAVLGLPGCANLTNFCASRNPVTELSLYSMPNLHSVECYNAGLTSVRVTNDSSLVRACFESNSITGTLDMSGCTSLGDFRAAANYITNAVFSGAEHTIWHFCLRDCTRLNPTFAATTLPGFTALTELIFWNAGQAGALTLPSTNLTWVHVYDNQFTEINFTNCAEFYSFDAHANRLTTTALDYILGELSTNSPNLVYLDLTSNGYASPASYSNFYSLQRRITGLGGTCLMDIPDTNSVPGPLSNSVTFVTLNRSPHLQIDAPGATNIVWHWGDGTRQTNATDATHDFGQAWIVKTNFVSVDPPTALLSFGEYNNITTYTAGSDYINTVLNLGAFTNMNTLFLWAVHLENLDITNCSSLRQVHLGGVCNANYMDKMLNDLNTAVAGTNSGASVWFDNPGSGCYCTGANHGVSTNSAAARDALYWKGWTTNMWCQ